MGSAPGAGAPRRRLIRAPAVAGSFYPAEAPELATAVDRLLAAVPGGDGRRPTTLIAPHAGYAYSGWVAAVAFATLRPWADQIARVAILGPAHFVPLGGCAVSPAAAWRTPLGDVPVDAGMREAALAAPGVQEDEGAHAPEHAIEVEVPFLQRLLPSAWRLLPIAVGDASPRDVATVIDAIEPVVDLVVVSTDLSHYLDDATARERDRRTADAVVGLDADLIGPDAACGRAALRGALEHARRSGRRPEVLALGTSADTGGGSRRVVGYGAFAIGP